MDTQTVLVVEDEPALLEAITFKLQQKNIDVMAASSGEQALELLKQKMPSLVWLDVFLPGISGLEVLEQIRRDPKLKDLAVIVVSASGGAEKVEKAKSMAAVDYLVKSDYSIDSLIDKVTALLDVLKLSGAMSAEVKGLV